jgi:glycosyltransferase involved in cell wall biosynthesis
VETLANLLKQTNPEVEVVVLDAASDDGTRQQVEGQIEGNPSLSYYYQETNRGIDRDYGRAAELGRGKYIWFMSDDDLLTAGAVGKVLEACRKDWNADLSERLGDPRLPFREDREYPPDRFVQLFEDVGHFLSFIPGVVVKKEIWSSREKEPYIGSFFAHLGVLFQAPLPGATLVLAEPLVRIRNGNISWSGRSFEIWMVRWPGLVNSLFSIPEKSRFKVSHPEPWRNPLELIEYRAMGAYSIEEYRKWIAPRTPPFSIRAVAIAVARAPGSLVNSLCIGYCLLFPRGKRIPLYNLRTSRFHIGKWFS